MTISTRTLHVPLSSVPAGYGPLYTYLAGRYADTVVLTFVDIEALLGFALPDPARLLPAWWSNDDEGNGGSSHAEAWIRAGRTARPNLSARIVVFERTPA